jgi:hypothetical protein
MWRLGVGFVSLPLALEAFIIRPLFLLGFPLTLGIGVSVFGNSRILEFW